MNDNETILMEDNSMNSLPSGKKPNLQMIVNIVLFAGLAVCLVLMILGKSGTETENKSAAGLNIAFINSDTLMSHYELFQDIKTDLEAETLKLRQDLEQREKTLQNQFQNYQKKVQAGTISYDDAQKTEENLARQQQELMAIGDQYTNQIALKEYEMSVRVFDSLNVVLELINEKNQYDYILGYTPGAGILYANPALEITEVVVEILNERYKKSKSKGNDQ
jgi:outer membrane protein